MNEIQHFFQEIEEFIKQDSFVKLTLSKPIRKSEDLENVYLREVELKKRKCSLLLIDSKQMIR